MGISFADCDAGFSAPFTVNTDSIKVVEILITNGKCLLQNIVDVVRIYIILSVVNYST